MREDKGAQPARRTGHVEHEDASGELVELPPWLQAIRDAMGSAIGAGDVREILQAQVAKAKRGDSRAANLVLNQAHKLIQGRQGRTTVYQSNYYGDAAAAPQAGPCNAEPGTPAKIAAMQRRAAGGMSVTDPQDAPSHAPLRADGDEQERELRRQLAADAARAAEADHLAPTGGATKRAPAGGRRSA